MVMERLERADAQRGALLDGFPRTQTQAEVLDATLAARSSAVRVALYLDVPMGVLVERIAGRWLCPSCQATYPSNSSLPPGNGLCRVCRDRLYQRADDRPEVVQHRIEVYLRETLPIIDHYARRGLLVRVDGNRSIEAVRVTLCSSLGGVIRGRRHDHWHLYISRQFHTDDDMSDWPGRTLCGQIVDHRSDRERGSEDSFRAHPCRHCHLELRPRQGPIVQVPAP
jgi:adenylate kinase